MGKAIAGGAAQGLAGGLVGGGGGGGSMGATRAMTPEQMELMKKLGEQLGLNLDQIGEIFNRDVSQLPIYQQGQETLSKLMGEGFDEAAFQSGVADPARKQLVEQTLPAVQERFIGAGGGRSSAANRALASAGTDLESSLAQQRFGAIEAQKNRAMQAAMGGLGFAELPFKQQTTNMQQFLQALGIGLEPAETIIMGGGGGGK